MKKFNRGGFKGGGYRGGGSGRGFNKPDYRNSDRGERMMHQAVCSDCGRDCEVPFQPTGGKPVFCNNCFQNHRDENPNRIESGRGGDRFNSYGGNNRDRFERKPSGSGNDDSMRRQIEALNVKLDKILKLLNQTPASVQPKKAKQPKAKPAAEPVVENATELDPNLLTTAINEE